MASKSPKSAARKSAADKLRENDANGTATGANAPKSESKPKAQPKPKATLTRAQLEKAATLKREGKTWQQIREALGVKTRGSGSSGFFAQWEKAGIKAPAKAKTGRAAVKPATAKPQASKAKAKRAPRRSGKAHGPRTTDGKAKPVRTRRASEQELAVAA